MLYLDRAADPGLVAEVITASLDRLGVCNRLNLLLVHAAAWDAMLGVAEAAFAARGVAASLPPHDHPLGHEWALDTGHEATVTVAPVGGPEEAAHVANEQTSGLAASVVTADAGAARAFLAAYAGTGAFWNASTRLLDGFKLRGVPETGHQRGPRPRPPRPRNLHRPLPPPVRGHPARTRSRATRPDDHGVAGARGASCP